jgi:hypothetical protein
MVLHFSLIGVKAFRESPMLSPLLKKQKKILLASEAYTQFSVMQADYSFFSPNISPDYFVKMTYQDSAGRWVDASFALPNKEVEKRFHSCLLGIQQMPNELTDIVIKSWAARILDQHPDAININIRVFASKLPKMQEFRARGRNPQELVADLTFHAN